METEPLPTQSPRRFTAHWLIIALLLVWAGLCIYVFLHTPPDQLPLSGRFFPSPTNTPTPKPAPTATITQQIIRATTTATLSVAESTATLSVAESTATAMVIQTSIATNKNWTVLLSEGFDTDKGRWDVGTEGSDTDGTLTRTIDNGKYSWDITSKKSFLG